MKHLEETGYGYFSHLGRAWAVAFVAFVHGLFPNVWETKVSDMVCSPEDEGV